MVLIQEKNLLPKVFPVTVPLKNMERSGGNYPPTVHCIPCFIEITFCFNMLHPLLWKYANTVEPQWLELLWNHENMFETGVVPADGVNRSARSGGRLGISFRFSLTWRYIVCSHLNCLLEMILMSTQNIPFSVWKRKHPKLSQICSYGIFSKELKKEFETAVVNEWSEFDPLKFYCMYRTTFYHTVVLYFLIYYIWFIELQSNIIISSVFQIRRGHRDKFRGN